MLDHRLKHVLAVASGGSFTAGAQAVGVTQSAVTKSVADLERELGFPVFYRTSRGAFPTEEGKSFLIRARLLLEDAADLMRGRHGHRGEVIRIAIAPTFLEWQLAKPLTQLRMRFPGIRIELQTTDEDRLAQYLYHGRVDLAFSFTDMSNEGFDFRRFDVSEIYPRLAVRQGHPLADSHTITSELIANYDIICAPRSQSYVLKIHDLYERHNVNPRTKLSFCDSLPIIFHQVVSSDAIGIYNFDDIGMAQRSQIVLLEEHGLLGGISLCAFAQSQSVMSQAALFLVQTVRDHYQTPAISRTSRSMFG